MTGQRVPGLDHRAWRRMLVATGIALAGELGVLGLLATGAWLLLSAALRPPILLLSVAIGVVQVLSLLRGTARYAERLASHGLGLGLQAGLRSWLYRRLERLLPAGLPGGDRGDLLARLISDTEEVQDLVVRAAVPVLAIAAAWLAAVATAAFLLPAAGWAILAAGITGTAGVTLAVILVRRNASALPAARAAVGSWVLGVLISGEELTALRADGWALARLGEREQALGARTRAVAAAAGLGRASCLCAGGAGLAAVAWTGAAAQRAGRISPVGLGVLVFLALGVAGLLQGLPDAVARLQVSRASLERLAGLGRMPAPVAVAAAGSCAASVRPGFHGRCRRSVCTVSTRDGRCGPAGSDDRLPEPVRPRPVPGGLRSGPGPPPRPSGRADRAERLRQDVGRARLATVHRPHCRPADH